MERYRAARACAELVNALTSRYATFERRETALQRGSAVAKPRQQLARRPYGRRGAGRRSPAVTFHAGRHLMSASRMVDRTAVAVARRAAAPPSARLSPGRARRPARVDRRRSRVRAAPPGDRHQLHADGRTRLLWRRYARTSPWQVLRSQLASRRCHLLDDRRPCCDFTSRGDANGVRLQRLDRLRQSDAARDLRRSR